MASLFKSLITCNCRFSGTGGNPTSKRWNRCLVVGLSRCKDRGVFSAASGNSVQPVWVFREASSSLTSLIRVLFSNFSTLGEQDFPRVQTNLGFGDSFRLIQYIKKKLEIRLNFYKIMHKQKHVTELIINETVSQGFSSQQTAVLTFCFEELNRFSLIVLG